MKIRRDKLMRLAQAGKLVMVGSYHYDEMSGQEISKKEIPVRLSSGYDDFIEGQCNLREHDFTSSCGSTYLSTDRKICSLHVHSNCNYDFRMADGSEFGGQSETMRGKRPENVRLQNFLAQAGIEATVKYIPDGSLKGTWRLYNADQKWTPELAAKLAVLGFVDFDGKPLGPHAGNGGVFSVFVRGHNELLAA